MADIFVVIAEDNQGRFSFSALARKGKSIDFDLEDLSFNLDSQGVKQDVDYFVSELQRIGFTNCSVYVADDLTLGFLKDKFPAKAFSIYTPRGQNYMNFSKAKSRADITASRLINLVMNASIAPAQSVHPTKHSTSNQQVCRRVPEDEHYDNRKQINWMAVIVTILIIVFLYLQITN